MNRTMAAVAQDDDNVAFENTAEGSKLQGFND